MAYQPYGYELNQLMDRYGVQSPVVPRAQEGQSAEAYQAILKQYQDSVSSTPEYNIPEGSPTYRQLLQNTLYGDPKTYYATRGISDPFQMFQRADVFGWTPQQWDYSMGKPPGTAQQWIDGNNPVSSRVPYTYPYATGNQPTPAGTNPTGGQQPTTAKPPTTTQTPTRLTPTPTPTPAPAPSGMNEAPWQYNEATGEWEAPAGYNAQNSSTWSPVEREYADNYTYDFRTSDLRDLESLQAYMNQAKSTVGNEFGTDNRIIDSGEASNIFETAATLNVSPAQIASMLGMEGVDESAVVNRLKTSYPTEALNYLKQYGHGYAEGGMVTGYAEGGKVDPLDAILERYMNRQEPDMTATMDAIRQNAAARKAAIEQMNVPQQGPSDSEKWLKLAAAFANPGQTGNFMEGVGQAAGVLAEHRGAQREFDAADAQRRNQAALAALGVDQEVAESELRLGLEDRDRSDRQLADLMRHYEGEADRASREKPDYGTLDQLAEAKRRADEARAAGNEDLAAVYESLLKPKPADDFSDRDQAITRLLQSQLQDLRDAAKAEREAGNPDAAAAYETKAAAIERQLSSMLNIEMTGAGGINMDELRADLIADPTPENLAYYDNLIGKPGAGALLVQSVTAPMNRAASTPESTATPAPPAQPAQAPLSTLEGFNLDAPTRENPTLNALQGGLASVREGITDALESGRNRRQSALAEKAVPMVKSIIASTDLYQLDLLSQDQIQAALQSGMLTPEETQIVTEYLSR